MWRQGFGWSGRVAFITLPGKGGHSGLMLSRLCDPPWRGQWGVLQHSRNKVWSAHGQYSDWLASRWSCKHHQPSGFSQPRVYLLAVSSFHLEGCIRLVSISFRELGDQWFCCVAELQATVLPVSQPSIYSLFLPLHVSRSLRFGSAFCFERWGHGKLCMVSVAVVVSSVDLSSHLTWVNTKWAEAHS